MLKSGTNFSGANCDPRRPTVIDEQLGRRVRLRRKLLDLSQMALADALGITHQQVQKYENGSSRISASRLFSISTALQTPVSWFFAGLGEHEIKPPAPKPDETGMDGNMQSEEGSIALLVEEASIRLLRLYYSIPDDNRRDDLLGFLESFADRNR